MGIVRVWDGGDNSDPRDGAWANAAQSVSGAVGHNTEPVQAGDTILIASDHYYSYSSTEFNISIPPAVRLVSVDRTTEVYTTGATEKMNTSSSFFNYVSDNTETNDSISIEGMDISFANNDWVYLGGRNGTISKYYYDCYISSNNYYGFIISNTNLHPNVVKVFNCILNCVNVSDYIFVLYGSSTLYLNNVSFVNTGSKSQFFRTDTGTWKSGLTIVVENCDLSFWSSRFVYKEDASAIINVVIRQCKLHSSFDISNEIELDFNDKIVFEYCSNTGTTATPIGVYAGAQYNGTFNFDTTVYRYGHDGENDYSIKLASNANTSFPLPLQTPRRIGDWHEANNLTKLYLYFVSNDTDLTDGDVWIHVNYNSHTSEPVGTFISTFATYGNETGADSSSYLKSAYLNQWNGAGFNTAYRFEVTGIQPQEPGPITVDFYLAKASTTVWVCPYMEFA